MWTDEWKEVFSDEEIKIQWGCIIFQQAHTMYKWQNQDLNTDHDDLKVLARIYDYNLWLF